MGQTDVSMEFGKGYANTGTIIGKWNAGINGPYNAAQDDHDIFKHIQSEYAKGWYIPSRGEWAAFADYFKQKTENGLTHSCLTRTCNDNDGNYDDLYGLSIKYWTSSKNGTDLVWYASFYLGRMDSMDGTQQFYVRLGITF